MSDCFSLLDHQYSKCGQEFILIFSILFQTRKSKLYLLHLDKFGVKTQVTYNRKKYSRNIIFSICFQKLFIDFLLEGCVKMCSLFFLFEKDFKKCFFLKRGDFFCVCLIVVDLYVIQMKNSFCFLINTIFHAGSRNEYSLTFC